MQQSNTTSPSLCTLGFLLLALALPSSMALAKEQALRNPRSGQAPLQVFDPSRIEFLGFKGHHSLMVGDGGYSDPFGIYPSNPSNYSSSDGYLFRANSPPQEALPVINFKSRSYQSSSVLSFEQGDRMYRASYSKLDREEGCATWIDAIDHDYESNRVSLKCGADSRFTQDENCFEMATGYSSKGSATNNNRWHGEERFGLLYSEAAADNILQDGDGEEGDSPRQPYMGEDKGASKKHCGSDRKSKAKPTLSKDPQGIAAKNRRERISERLRTLQELVPNGTKVDLVTMLEKAISYVKFLQLQVEVLATDELWPAQGGKAPEVAQVKEAIDAILASHRDRSS